MKHECKPCINSPNVPIDRNDPELAAIAREYLFPTTFSERAWKVIRYFEGAMYLFVYKMHYVVTDESLELTDFGDGSPAAPIGGPRWVGTDLDELEKWLESIADDYDADGEIPGWEVEA